MKYLVATLIAAAVAVGPTPAEAAEFNPPYPAPPGCHYGPLNVLVQHRQAARPVPHLQFKVTVFHFLKCGGAVTVRYLVITDWTR